MYRYTLPNGVVLNTHQLIDAVVESADFPHCYLDLDTGVVLTVNSQEVLSQWKRGVSALSLKHYLKLTPFPPSDQDQIAQGFITDVIALIMPNKVTVAKEALMQGGWEGVEDFLAAFAPELIEGWYLHLDMHGGARLHEIIMGQDYVEIEADLRGCGDCTTCKLEQTGQEIDEAKLQELETEEIMQHVARQLDLRRQNGE
ncbi:hypothetical protein A3C87_01130 [Candidatus Kaiserbacteria bacterium RIFCSPHIGHO2_02_FULL_49_34]|uniref:Uncharacterized protein n=1 Tax=Candidatus Kaiserbacteria bacterium RIFCSPHIGHO2_02_FULL_49_34 TaxID=1798491 RepID=A0A1F6DLA6_9BACT|nr:MAG: hypothetical protein A3C87_01130 [Candidatus Kaiserbacteria bacterium RIFCSPHIGHO2_02_FULL_49_34]